MNDSYADTLPPLYAAWMSEVLDGSLPAETDASCSSCAMLSDEFPAGSTEYFSKATKCCAYIPYVPNFLAGRELESGSDTVSSTSVLTRLEQGRDVHPLGLLPSPVFTALYSIGSDVFGRTETLRCPHFVEKDGGCGIWRNRNSICSTWFCKHVRGHISRKFWTELRDLLRLAEDELAIWSAMELGIDSATLADILARRATGSLSEVLTGTSIDGKADPAHQRMVWGKWYTQEAEFFLSCAKLVSQLRWNDVLSIAGPSLRARISLVREALSAVQSTHLSARLKLGNFRIHGVKDGKASLVSYSAFDPFVVPAVLLNLLPLFDGRPSAEVLNLIDQEYHIVIEESLLRKLVDFQILLPVQE